MKYNIEEIEILDFEEKPKEINKKEKNKISKEYIIILIYTLVAILIMIMMIMNIK